MLTEPLAARIAAGNQGTDCKACIRDNSAIPGAGEIHWRTLKQAENSAISEAAHASQSTPEEFGRALHGVQDYYTHRSNGFTASPGLKGFREYLAGVLAEGEEFSSAGAGNSLQWGHSGTSAEIRIPALDPFTAQPGDPDWFDAAHPTEADRQMMAKTEYWTTQYFESYFDTHSEELWWLLAKQKQGR